jgi:outer membrane protein TolC
MGACSHYKKDPINLSSETQRWNDQTLQATAAQTKLTTSQIYQLGLIMNPDLNRARIKAANSRAVTKQTGWWDDPSLSWDIKRVLSGSRNINFDAGLELSIPLTGIPALERKTAALYAESDFWSVRQTELDFLVKADQARIELARSTARSQLIRNRQAKLQEEVAQIQKLAQLGEESPLTRQQAERRLNETVKELMTADMDAFKARAELIKLLGLSPAKSLGLGFDLPSLQSIPATVSVPSPDALTHAPKILSQLATYNASEQELKTEIRRQYPNLRLGPGFTRDDGDSQIGGSIGFDLPLWNRNRKAIAESKGKRAEQRQETILLWRELLTTSQQLGQEQQLALKQCQTSSAQNQRLSDHVAQTEQLFKLGECTMSDLSESRQAAYEAQLLHIDTIAQLMQTQAQLRFLTNAPITSTK